MGGGRSSPAFTPPLAPKPTHPLHPPNPPQQSIPGKVWLAWFDKGGPEVAYHSYDGKNHGSCELNNCTGVNAVYKNLFRKVGGVGGWVGGWMVGWVHGYSLLVLLGSVSSTHLFNQLQDEGASTSYTKPPNGGWPGDRFTLIPPHPPTHPPTHLLKTRTKGLLRPIPSRPMAGGRGIGSRAMTARCRLMRCTGGGMR